MKHKLYEYIKNYNLCNTDTVIQDSDDLKIKLLKILKKRIYDAKQAYMLLIDKNLTSDAILIAGHILETAATIMYINDSNNKHHISKYIAQSEVQYLYSLFQNIAFAENEDLKGCIEGTISSLKQDGFFIINNRITKEQSEQKALNEHVLNMLSNQAISYETKVKIIEIFYNLPKVSDYIRYFCKQMEEQLGTKELPKIQQPISTINAFYDKYCEIKHASVYCCSYEEFETNKLQLTNFGSEQSLPIVAYSLKMIKNI